MRNLLFFPLLAACAAEEPVSTATPDAGRAALATCEAWGGTYAGVTFTDEEATNAIDFADTATAVELEAVYGVGPVTADRIIAARPFATQADPLAALDAVAYVAADELASFRDDSYGLWCGLDDGRQSCCVDLACEGLGDTVSAVTFTDAEAQATLDWANRATQAELEAVCQVGPVVASNIAAYRPIHSLLQLDLVPYVTGSQLRGMLGTTTCTTEGDVDAEWCALSGADCTCAATCEDELYNAWEPWRDAVVDDVETLIDAIPVNHDDLCGPAPESSVPFVTQVGIDHAADCSDSWYDVIYQQNVDDGVAYLISVRIASDLHWEVVDCDII